VLGTDRFLLSAGGTTFAQAMTRVLGHPVLTFPLPVQHELPCCHAESADLGKSPLIVFLGRSQQRKGSDLIGFVIPRVLEQYPDCQFLFQANPESWEKRWQDEVGPVAMARKHGGGAVMFPRFEVAAIAEASCRALQALPELTREMEGIRSAWRESMDMKAFFCCAFSMPLDTPVGNMAGKKKKGLARKWLTL
jgi:hypothetical protein